MDDDLLEVHGDQETHGPEPSHEEPVMEENEPRFQDEMAPENNCDLVPDQTRPKRHKMQPQYLQDFVVQLPLYVDPAQTAPNQGS